MSWPGADPSVPPCTQTIGTTSHGMHRWNTFVQTKLPRYGKNRNDARLVHASSRMSAYLNLGIVSIFRLVGEVKRQQREQNTTKGASATQPMRRSRWDKSGADKLEEEIVKFREMSYAHAFSRDDYDDVSTLPQWGVTCLNNHPNVSRYTLKQLANGTTGDATWNAMQRYLANTGELHNNVRMTWGKTVVEWVGCSASPAANVGGVDCSPAQLTLRTLCYLNDRYALDGLSPPSYAGLLWCAGWSDKPSGSGTWTISKKPAHRYRLKAEEFGKAERKLLTNPQLGQLAIGEGSGSDVVEAGMKRQRSVLDMMKMQSAGASTLNAPKKGKAEPKYDEHGSERSPSSRGTKRNTNSTTISSFFVKDPKKGKKNYSRIVG